LQRERFIEQITPIGDKLRCIATEVVLHTKGVIEEHFESPVMVIED
jgi:hypothetical protein